MWQKDETSGNVPWESEKMQKASNRVGKISNWEAESCSLMEGTRKRRSFPNSSDERVGAIDESRLALIRLSWHWDDSASSPPPSFRSTPPNDYRCSLHFSQSHRSVSLLRIPCLPPSPLRFLLIKTLSTLKCSTTSSRILFVRSSCLPPPPPSFCYLFFFMKCEAKKVLLCAIFELCTHE